MIEKVKEENRYIREIFSIPIYEKDNNLNKTTKNTEEYYSIKKVIEKKQGIFNYIFKTLSFVQLWTEDMYIFLDFLIKNEFEFFINADNNELTYHSIGFLVYCNEDAMELSIVDRVELITKTYNYFRYNKKLINLNNIKNHILLRFSNPNKFNKFNDEIINHEKILEEKESTKKAKEMFDFFSNNPIKVDKLPFSDNKKDDIKK